jgi:hypothetical protein
MRTAFIGVEIFAASCEAELIGPVERSRKNRGVELFGHPGLRSKIRPRQAEFKRRNTNVACLPLGMGAGCHPARRSRWLNVILEILVFVVSVLGGLVSSASITASAAALTSVGWVLATDAGIATVLTSMSSALINLPLVYQQTRQGELTRKLALRSTLLVIFGRSF